MDIIINANMIEKIDLKRFMKYAEWEPHFSQFLVYDVGKEHYKLLSYIVKNYLNKDDLIIDIGTFIGLSALALSCNGNRVVSYDVKDNIPDDKLTIKNIDNIEYIIGDCLDDKELLLRSKLIMLDIDHSGIEEEKILNMLRENNYKGIVIMDDINIFEPMKQLWDSIKEKKYELTKYGHWSGTGIILFSEDDNIIFQNQEVTI
jgi:predicted O-methyltransferase YrrM